MLKFLVYYRMYYLAILASESESNVITEAASMKIGLTTVSVVAASLQR